MPVAERFTPEQIATIVTLERVGGSISLAAVALVFLAYGLVRRVRNVQNTFIVFASVSNVGASIASIIAMDGLALGTRSALCQTQSFFFQMFMQSDPWWSLAMAINVFLVFYFRTSPDSFRRWWWIYCVVCYGGPFIIALSLLLVRPSTKGPVYGDATIWCWVDSQWDSIRIYTYYLLIWICIAGSILCYALVGYHVFRSRNRLRSFSATKSRDRGRVERLPSDDRGRPDGFYGTVTTEVQIVRTSATDLTSPQRVHLTAQHDAHLFQQSPQSQSPAAQYFSTVSAIPRRKAAVPGPLGRIATATNSAASKFFIEDPIKRAYLRTSLLFAFSVLFTWIPSSLNRIYGWLQGQSPYQFHVATSAVLPLQGLWNCIIFFMSSWDAVREHTLHKLEGTRFVSRHAGGFGANHRVGRRRSTEFEDDSVTMGSDVELRAVKPQKGKVMRSFDLK